MATVANTSREIEEKITSLAFPMGKQLNAVEKAYAGDIIATSKLKETLTGETLAAKERQVILDPIVFPASSISFTAAKPMVGRIRSTRQVTTSATRMP